MVPPTYLRTDCSIVFFKVHVNKTIYQFNNTILLDNIDCVCKYVWINSVLHCKNDLFVAIKVFRRQNICNTILKYSIPSTLIEDLKLVI